MGGVGEIGAAAGESPLQEAAPRDERTTTTIQATERRIRLLLYETRDVLRLAGRRETGSTAAKLPMSERIGGGERTQGIWVRIDVAISTSPCAPMRKMPHKKLIHWKRSYCRAVFDGRGVRGRPYNWLISTGGGTRPLWARNGQELFYESMGAIMRVPLTITSTFAAGTPTKLFEGSYFFGSKVVGRGRTYDVSTDDKRFLMIKEARGTDEPSQSARIVLVHNWFDELKRRVPTKH